jgi:preprotein translocase subunit SecG
MKASTFLSKATTVAAIVFICTTVTLDILQAQKGRSLFQMRQRTGEEKIDVEKMKQALEKIKQEAQKQEATARGAAQDAKKAAVSGEQAKAKNLTVTESVTTQAPAATK